MKKLSILLFAAGLGTRMGPLVIDRPKPLVRVGGKPLLDHALNLTNLPEVERRAVNVHYRADMIRIHLASQDVAISDETDVLRETGGGLRHALPLLGSGPVLTLNTDAVWKGTNPIRFLVSQWNDDMDAMLLLVPKARAIGHRGSGDFVIGENGQLTRGAGDIYTGLQIVRTDLLASIPETAFSMNVLWDKMAAQSGLFGVAYDGLWCDVGQPESIALAEEMLGVDV